MRVLWTAISFACRWRWIGNFVFETIRTIWGKFYCLPRLIHQLWINFMEVRYESQRIHSQSEGQKARPHVLGEAEIIECIGDNLYLAEVNGVRCTAIFNFFTGAYYVDDVYGIRQEVSHA